jgi:hypothetical protein
MADEKFSSVFSSTAANTAAIVAGTFETLRKDSVVVELKTPHEKAGGVETRQVPITNFFGRIFFSVLGITILCLVLEIGLAFLWVQPSTLQQNAVAAVDFGWKAGFGVIIGLISGKQA